MSGEKTEKPTRKKLEDARKKGQVAVSKDVQIVAKLGLFYMVFFWLSEGYAPKFVELLNLIVDAGFHQKGHFSPDIFSAAMDVFFIIIGPLVAACAIAATLTTWAQIGFLVAPEALMPSFKKFDAVSNLKNMLSKKSFIQLILNVCKVGILAWVAYLTFMDSLPNMINSYRVGVGYFFVVLVDCLKDIIFFSLGLFIAIALIDWVAEYTNYIKNNKMSKHDIKDEHKQSDGNPESKRRMKKEHKSLLNSSLNKMGDAKAVVANPTHISVALDYEPGKHDLPFIVCMGVDEEAMEMRQKAKELGIPVIVNVDLARSLYRDCEEEEYIRKEHLVLAAEVFRAVLALSKSPESAPGQGPSNPPN